MSDFQSYAKSMAWLCDFPLQRSQELLARAYGYSGLHELQQAMKRPGEPGPFEHQWSEDEFNQRSVVGGQLYFADPKSAGEWSYRLLSTVAAEKGLEIEKLSSRLFFIRDLLLFDPPAQQREAYRRLRAILDVIDGNDDDSLGRSPTVYAYLKEEGESKYLAFTEFGQNVFNAARELVPDSAGRLITGSTPDECTEKLEGIIQRHPFNPWPRAMFICGFANYYFQDGWASKLRFHRDTGFDLDHDPGFEQYRVSNAKNLLPHAQTAISLFEELYGSHKGKAPEHWSRRPGADAFYWPAVLYFGGLIALNAGRAHLAKKWLALHHTLCPDDKFGAREYRAVIALNEGKQTVRTFVRRRDVWAKILVAAEAANAEDYTEAVELYGDAIVDTWASIEAFSGYWNEARGCSVWADSCTPAHLKELTVRTAPFWKKHRRTQAFFESMSRNPALREAALALHQDVSASVESIKQGKPAHPYQLAEARRQKLQAELKAAAVRAGEMALAELGTSKS